MRDLLFKNLTSNDRRRRILVTSEKIDKAGVRSIIHRHFICLVKEIKDKNLQKPEPYLYVLKESNRKAHQEKFFCRLKGSLYAISGDKLYLILFMHSLKITLIGLTQDINKSV